MEPLLSPPQQQRQSWHRPAWSVGAEHANRGIPSRAPFGFRHGSAPSRAPLNMLQHVDLRSHAFGMSRAECSAAMPCTGTDLANLETDAASSRARPAATASQLDSASLASWQFSRRRAGSGCHGVMNIAPKRFFDPGTLLLALTQRTPGSPGLAQAPASSPSSLQLAACGLLRAAWLRDVGDWSGDQAATARRLGGTS